MRKTPLQKWYKVIRSVNKYLERNRRGKPTHELVTEFRQLYIHAALADLGVIEP